MFPVWFVTYVPGLYLVALNEPELLGDGARQESLDWAKVDRSR